MEPRKLNGKHGPKLAVSPGGLILTHTMGVATGVACLAPVESLLLMVSVVVFFSLAPELQCAKKKSPSTFASIQ